MLETLYHEYEVLNVVPVLIETDDDEPRAYSFNDLQSAFIVLGVGLFANFLVFVGELLTDPNRNSVMLKIRRGFEQTCFMKRHL